MEDVLVLCPSCKGLKMITTFGRGLTMDTDACRVCGGRGRLVVKALTDAVLDGLDAEVLRLQKSHGEYVAPGFSKWRSGPDHHLIRSGKPFVGPVSYFTLGRTALVRIRYDRFQRPPLWGQVDPTAKKFQVEHRSSRSAEWEYTGESFRLQGVLLEARKVYETLSPGEVGRLKANDEMTVILRKHRLQLMKTPTSEGFDLFDRLLWLVGQRNEIAALHEFNEWVEATQAA